MGYKSGKIDLHIHSSASDGSLSPDKIIARAQHLGLSAISITDHDTLAGTQAALSRGKPDSLEIVSGIEMSAAYPPDFRNPGSMHILGYGIRTDHPGLNALLEKQQEARIQRNPKIIQRLNELDIPVSLEAIAAEAGKQDIARPHIAEYLVKHGYVESIDDAFDRLLGKNKPAYVDKYRVPAHEAIDLIRAAGGLAVLAHPVLFDTGWGKTLEDLLATLKDFGLGGIEVYYPGQKSDQIRRYEQLADRFELLPTGGTDFHGDINKNIEMGSGLGDLHIPYTLFERLKAALAMESRSR